MYADGVTEVEVTASEEQFQGWNWQSQVITELLS